jgi:4-oxalocrotonate tautomerase
MPHVIVKLYPGRSLEVKQRLCEAIVRNLVEIAGCKESSVSLAIEEVPADAWAERVYRADIQEKKDTLLRKPGYTPPGYEGL